MLTGKHINLGKLENILYYLLILFLPTQLGKHFWPDFSLVLGLRVDYLSPTIYLTDILVVLLFLVWAFNIVTSKHSMRVWKNRNVLAYLAFVAFLLLTVLLSGNVTNGLYHIVKFIECSFVAFYTATALGKTISLEKLSGVLAIGIIGESLLAIAQYVLHSSVGGIMYFFGERTFNSGTPGIANASINGELILRPYGTFPHPNVLAGYLVVSMLLVFFYLFPSKRKLYKAVSVAALFLGTAALLLTLSRVAIALWLVLVLGFFIWQIRSTFKQSIQTAALSVATLIILFTAMWFAFSQTLSPRFLQTTLVEESVIQRAVLIDISVKLIAAHPLFGIGLGNFIPALATFHAPLSVAMYLQPVHNIFLLSAAETGLIGLSVFIWLLLSLFFKLLRMLRLKKHQSREILGLILVLVTILILGQFDHYFLTLQQGQLLFAMIVGMCFTAGKKTLHLGREKNTRSS